MITLDKLLTFRLIRFGLTGGLATLIHITFAFAVIRFVYDNAFIANVLGFSFAFLFSYLAQTLFVFKKRMNWINAARFFLVQFGALLLSQAISNFFPETNSYVKVIIVVCILPVITYLIHRVWTYSNSADEGKHIQ